MSPPVVVVGLRFRHGGCGVVPGAGGTYSRSLRGRYTSGHGYRMPVRSTGSVPASSIRWTRRFSAVTSSSSSSSASSAGTASASGAMSWSRASGDGVAGEVPDHRAQFESCREAETVVDAPDPAVVAAQHVAAFAVGVVGDEVEEGDPGQLRVGLGASSNRVK